ncbi:MAG TPA: helix-turn-helix domain-containing protein [Sphingomicrobium sp.]|nr:helix-turn-helix domain-containing protein [Sphingomicrobium sp.]
MFELDENKVRRLLAVRRVREKHLGPGLFADPAWDILLEALASELGKKVASVSDLCNASAVPESAAQRWIRTLEMDGWLRRCAPPGEGRDSIELTSKGSVKLRLYFAAVAPGLLI